MKKIFLMAALIVASIAANAQDESITKAQGRGNARHDAPDALITNIPNRDKISLNGEWNTIVDPFENGYYNYRREPMAAPSTFFADKHFYQHQNELIEYDFDASPVLNVPGDWNTQRPQLYYYEGTVWYRRTFSVKPEKGMRYFVHFGAANYETIVALNGAILGSHVGGYTPFNFEVTDLLRDGENSLVVKVDNKRKLDGVPTVNSDWWNYGGLTRDVNLVKVPDVFVRDYSVQLGADGKSIEGWVRLDGGSADVSVAIPELKIDVKVQTDGSGYAAFSAKPAKKLKIERWSWDNPKLYEVCLKTDADILKDRIGFRTIETRGREMLLNGEPVYCRGVSIHEERVDQASGRAYSEEHARAILGLAKEMGCNFVRLAHYPHNEYMIRVAEEMGIMVWSEIPVYWTIDWSNEGTYANAENQLTEMITRDRNRANVIIWSVANETPRSPERLAFLSGLIDKARELDPTRLVSAAMEKGGLPNGKLTVDDELLAKTDLISFNQYVGWYDGNSDKCLKVAWEFPVEKPVIVSEFGGGALYGRHGNVGDRFTEEYLVDLYEKNIIMLSRIPGLAGTTPWILKDFRSPRRALYGIQDDFNRKGLVSEKGEKKDAFFVMKRWYESMK